MLKKQYVRDGQRRIVGSVTVGFVGSFDTLVRDEHEQVTGWTSAKFHTTRDQHGRLASITLADPGLLLKRNR